MASITAGSRFSAPSAVAGSPGNARIPRKTSMLARRRTTRAAPSLRSRKPPIVCYLLLEPCELRADEAVAVDLHAADRLRDTEAVDRVVQVDQRQVFHDLRHGGV